ncbi:MAG TPA: HAMP domain-containing sensor histidine kinase [Paracoccus sp. (in: a-proteobacteria)]|nr:HAMP domain-containing sensor histidine kinase [Paracoccus sp. (in: a-proteobacteria)]
MTLGSIRARLLALAAVWLTLALLGAWWVIGGVLGHFVTDRFDAELAAVADTVIAGAQTDATGGVWIAAPPTDPRFAMPLSDWFWQLETADGTALARSPSLLDLSLTTTSPAAWTGGRGPVPDGKLLRVLRRPFTLPGVDAPLAVTVTAPQADIDAALSRVRRPLALSLAVLGAGLVLASLVQVAAGLRTLDTMGRGIRAIRAGQAESLPLPPVAELRPIAIELNGLLDQNRAVLARARDHLGNLAHSLKTPMAALANALPPDHPGQTLIRRMDRQIGWHLRRARSAGAPRLLGHTAPVAEVIDDILLVLRHPAADRGLSVQVACPPAARFAGERQDLEEMLGNLLENAVKYARTHIGITVAPQPGTIRIAIADDGPGMGDQDHARALSRGGRLDEAGPPGAGLGLAIVADLAALHGGRLNLGRSDRGGLLAELDLPA